MRVLNSVHAAHRLRIHEVAPDFIEDGSNRVRKKVW
jgi:hypothetical protein